MYEDQRTRGFFYGLISSLYNNNRYLFKWVAGSLLSLAKMLRNSYVKDIHYVFKMVALQLYFGPRKVISLLYANRRTMTGESWGFFHRQTSRIFKIRLMFFIGKKFWFCYLATQKLFFHPRPRKENDSVRFYFVLM